MTMDPEWLPAGFRPLQTQVAGHTFLADTHAIGLLQDAEAGSVLKPLGKPVCGERELAFYETLQQTKDPVLQQLRALVPQYRQQVRLNINESELVFIKLENLTYGMEKPCIMDIKVGRRTWDPLSTPHKRAVEEEKYVQCKQAMGLCIPGFQVYEHGSGKLLRHGKEYGKQLNAQSFRQTIKHFLNAQSPNVSVAPILREVLRQLYIISKWFSVQTQLHFYASSLLIAYDFEVLERLQSPLTNGYAENNGQSYIDATSTLRPAEEWIKVRMIDFAHVFPAENGALDTNYIFGLNSLIGIIEQLVKER